MEKSHPEGRAAGWWEVQRKRKELGAGAADTGSQGEGGPMWFAMQQAGKHCRVAMAVAAPRGSALCGIGGGLWLQGGGHFLGWQVLPLLSVACLSRDRDVAGSPPVDRAQFSSVTPCSHLPTGHHPTS